MLIRFNRKSRAQSTAEYAILIGLVIAAAVAMQVYVKRGLQARVHDASQLLVTQSNILDTADGQRLQYEPYYLNSNFDVSRNSSANAFLGTTGNYQSRETSNVTRLEGGSQTYRFSNADDANR
jgi:hypothetical protein